MHGRVKRQTSLCPSLVSLMFMSVTGVMVCVGECLADALLANARRERWGWVSLHMTHAGLVLFFVFYFEHRRGRCLWRT